MKLLCPSRNDYQDPESHNSFIVHTRVNVRANVTSDGDVGSIEYIEDVQLNEDEDMECCECGYYGPVSEFQGGGK